MWSRNFQCFSIKNEDLTRLHRQTNGQTEKDDSYIPQTFFRVVGVGCNKTSVFYRSEATTYIKKIKRWQWLTRTAFIKSLFIQNIFVTAKQDFVSYVNILSLLSKACQQSMKFYFFKSNQLFQTTIVILNGKMAN